MLSKVSTSVRVQHDDILAADSGEREPSTKQQTETFDNVGNEGEVIELPKPGAFSVASAAPQGKSGRMLSKVSTSVRVQHDDILAADSGEREPISKQQTETFDNVGNEEEVIELPKPGAFSVASAAPQGKSGRMLSKVSTSVRVQHDDSLAANSGETEPISKQQTENLSNLPPTDRPENGSRPATATVPGTTATDTDTAKPTDLATSVRVRSSRRGDTKAAIREEMNVLRSQGAAQTPGAISVSSSLTATPASPPEPMSSSSLSSSSRNTKAAIKQEIEVLRSHPELNRPGAHSISSSTSSLGEKGSASRAERPSRRTGKLNDSYVKDKIKSSITQSSTTIQPGAIPSTAESTAASEKALLLKTGDAQTTQTVGAVQATAADDKSKIMKVGTAAVSTTIPATNSKDVQTTQTVGAVQATPEDDKSKIMKVDTAAVSTTIPATNSKVSNEKLDTTKLVDEKLKAEVETVRESFTPQPSHERSSSESDLVEANGLVAAQVIDEEELEAQYQAKMMKSVVAAEIVSEDEFKERGRCWKMSCCCIIILILAITIPLSRKNNNDIVYPPTAAPTEQSEYDFLYDLFLPYSGNTLNDNSTIQYRALEWLAFEDPMGLPIKDSNETILIERYAAVVFYFATGGEKWKNQYNFLTNTSICDWNDGTYFGLTCYSAEEVLVRYIEFSDNNLNGTIPTEVLGFSRADTLSITYGLSGTIPSELGDMTSLTMLQLPGNNITGTIPATLSKLKLGVLNLNLNNLTGTIPEGMFRMNMALRHLILSQNQIGGALPDIKRQAPMINLLLGENKFEGTIPQSYFEQDNLLLLGLEDNLITGTIPEQIRAMKSLAYLHLQRNRFTGTIPSVIAELRDMEEIFLEENQLDGPIPTEFGNIQLLSSLKVSGNRLTGTLPSELGNLISLISLNVSSTGLSGTVPSSFSQLTSLVDFDLTNTDIVDGLDQVFCIQPNLLTSIRADCLGDNATIPCDCCTTCCRDGVCEVDTSLVCETKSSEFESAPDRGTTCDCQQGGAKMSCMDTTCESCNLDESLCVQSTDYGYGFDEATGETLSFQNVIQYTKGRNDTLVFTKNADELFCHVEVNGQECLYCATELCESGIQSYRVDCSNLDDGPVLFPCGARKDVQYLEVFFMVEKSLLSGCPPVFVFI